METPFVGGSRVKLDPGDLIQTGGEGMVFAWRDQAIKIYHDPTERRARKLSAFFDEGLHSGLPYTRSAPPHPLPTRTGACLASAWSACLPGLCP